MSFLDPQIPALVLAPMEGVTDFPMRTLLAESGAFRFGVSEFVRVSQEIPPPKVFHRYVPELLTPGALPISVQILGGDPEKMAASALVAVECGAKAIDINFGCPAPTVNRHDGGATLLKDPCRIEAVVQAVRAAVPRNIPVSAKLRLGWDDPSSIHMNAERAARGGASWITIHGRTRMQGYAPPALWEPIGEVRRALDIPVVANGDLWTREALLRCQEVTGCIHFMLGRGAVASPWLPRELATVLGIALPPAPSWDCPATTDRSDWAAVMRRFVQLSETFFAKPGYTSARLKQWVKMASLQKPIDWFDTLKPIQTVEEVNAWLAGSNLPQTPMAECR